MDALKCSHCGQVLSVNETVTVSGDRIRHLDCRRTRTLTPEERSILFQYCREHVVAKCPACDQSYRQSELGSDLMADRTNLCPRCRADLTDAVRAHVFACSGLPKEIQEKARAVRETYRELIKRSAELVDRADVLMREAEAVTAELRMVMSRNAVRRQGDPPDQS